MKTKQQTNSVKKTNSKPKIESKAGTAKKSLQTRINIVPTSYQVQAVLPFQI